MRKYEHTYPHSWRTDKPVLYYPLDAWFIKTTAKKDQLVASATRPSTTGNPRAPGTGPLWKLVREFGGLEFVALTLLGHNRYPSGETKDGKEEILHLARWTNLKSEMEKATKAGIQNPESSIKDLHRPYVDNIVLLSSSGQPMYREPTDRRVV